MTPRMATGCPRPHPNFQESVREWRQLRQLHQRRPENGRQTRKVCKREQPRTLFPSRPSSPGLSRGGLDVVASRPPSSRQPLVVIRPLAILTCVAALSLVSGKMSSHVRGTSEPQVYEGRESWCQRRRFRCRDVSSVQTSRLVSNPSACPITSCPLNSHGELGRRNIRVETRHLLTLCENVPDGTITGAVSGQIWK